MAKYDLEIEIRPPRCPSCRNDITYRIGRGIFHGLIALLTGFKRYRCRYCERRFWATGTFPILTRTLIVLLLAFVVLGYLVEEGLLKLPNAQVRTQTAQIEKQAPVITANKTTGLKDDQNDDQAAAYADDAAQQTGQGGGEIAQAESSLDPAAETESGPAGVKGPVEKTQTLPPLKPEAIIFFKVCGFKPGPEQRPLLQKLVALAKARPGLIISLVGFADASPLSAASKKIYGDNKGISKARAQAVAEALTALGVAPDRLEVIGGGVDSRAADANAARRVEAWPGRVKVDQGKVTAPTG